VLFTQLSMGKTGYQVQIFTRCLIVSDLKCVTVFMCMQLLFFHQSDIAGPSNKFTALRPKSHTLSLWTSITCKLYV